MGAGSTTFLAGERAVGVRFTDASVRNRVEAALAAHVVPGCGEPPIYEWRTETAGRGPGVHVLSWGPDRVVRSRRLQRVVEGLAGHLGAYARWQADGLIVDAVAVVRGRSAVLLPASLRDTITVLDRRLASKGVAVVDRPWAELDPETADLVVAPPVLPIDWAALGGGDAKPETPPLSRFALRQWVLGGAVVPASPGQALAAAAAVARVGALPRTPLEPVAAVLERVPYCFIESDPLGSLPSLLDDLLDS